MAPPGRGRGGRRQDRSGGRDRNRSGERDNSERHPRGLRGKAIGLFYARKNQERREAREGNGEARYIRPLGTIHLSGSKKQYIQEVLGRVTRGDMEKTEAYDHIQDSLFKRNFLRVLNESISDKLQRVTSAIKRDESLDQALYSALEATKANDARYKAMLKKRKKLPSFSKKDQILELIEANQVVVISGETGCGKTTQVAQFILDDYIEKKRGSCCKIICTQPRRISAITVAERVADERAERLGTSVGYQIRLENRFPREKGSILFCTTGVVLKQMETNPGLSSISHLILDEIHERDVMSDFILALIKQVVLKRRDLKVILMSATLNSDKFSKYYGNAPHLNIPGFTYPVQEYYLEDVLERTRFEFGPCKGIRGRNDHRRDSKAGWKMKEFDEYIAPHLRLMEAERKYSSHVMRQLWNPESEAMVSLDLIRDLIIDICEKEDDQGAILVFLTGFMEISSLNQLLEDSDRFPRSRCSIFPLHSLMPTVDQKQIFETPPPGIRKIILSTNIAETSITIDDVVFVIDCGRIKIANFDVENNTETLEPEWVSLANAGQRKGRAGRVQPGKCFHLYTKAREMLLEQYQKPEVLRKRLEGVILNAKMMQLGKIEPFFQSLIDCPEPEAVTVAVTLLKQMEALTDSEELTPLGYHLAKLPMAPQLGKMVLYGAIFSCLDPVLSVAATLDFKDAFQLPLGKEKEADRRRQMLADNHPSDHLLYHFVLNKFERSGDPSRFAWDNFLSQQTLRLLLNMKKQFMDYLHEMNFVANSDLKSPHCNRNSSNLSLVKAIVCAGLFPNVAIRQRQGKATKYKTAERRSASLHPKSVLTSHTHLDRDLNLLAYYKKVKSTAEFIHDGTAIYPLPVVFFGDNLTQLQEGEHHSIMINNRFKFKCTESQAAIFKELRTRFSRFLEHKIAHPGPVDWTQESAELKILEYVFETILCSFFELQNGYLSYHKRYDIDHKRITMELIASEDAGEYDDDAFDDDD